MQAQRYGSPGSPFVPLRRRRRAFDDDRYFTPSPHSIAPRLRFAQGKFRLQRRPRVARESGR